MRLVERHRETGSRRGSGPGGEDCFLWNVADLNLALVGDVHENASSGLFKLKRLRMCVNDNLPAFLSISVKKRQDGASLRPRSQRLLAAVPDHNTAAPGVIADVVGVIRKLDRGQKLKTGSVVDPGVAIAGGDE